MNPNFGDLDRRCDDLVPWLGTSLERETLGMKPDEMRFVIQGKVTDLYTRADLPGGEGDRCRQAAMEVNDWMKSF